MSGGASARCILTFDHWALVEEVVPEVLRHVWANFGSVFRYQPLDAIRRYYGEHIAFYFAWIGFYTQMLVNGPV